MGIASLDAALTGLRVSQQQISVISNNVANATTEGYTRKILPQVTQTIEGVTVGALAGTIIRNVDISLERDLWTQKSSTEFYDIQATYLSRIEAFHGPPDAELTIANELGRLYDTFSALSDSPESTFLQANVVDQAVDTANKINDLSDLITTLRNDAQEELTTTVETINNLLAQIAEFNTDIKFQLNTGNTTAAAEDQRSIAISELSELIEISFFTRGDGVLVVQTNEGAELVSERYEPLTFNATPQFPSTYYPDSAGGVYIGDPTTNATAFDLTTRSPGGKLGGLLTLRDTTFPKQMAQLDELAHKLALRFEEQGLRLFTDQSGNVPLDTAPDLTTDPETTVTYVGFSAEIRVNTNVINDNSLVQQGTYGASLESGDNEVIRRVLDYTFTDISYQEAIGTLDLDETLTTIQAFLGIYAENTLTGGVDLNAYADMSDLITAAGDELALNGDTFIIRFSDPDIGGSFDVEIDLSAVADSGGDAGDDLVAAITADADWANIAANYAGAVSINSDGQLVIDSRSDIQILTGGANPISDTGLAFLGLGQVTQEATDPYFDIQVGNNPVTRITVDAGLDQSDFLTLLQAVPGLAVEDFTTSADGFLRLRPGDDYDDPNFGGDIKIIAGLGTTVAADADANAVIGAGTIVDGLNIVSALFGNFTAGPPVQDGSVVTDVSYGSAISTTNATTTAFRTDFLGPDAAVSTTLLGALDLVDYAQKMVNEQTQELILLEQREEDEQVLHDIINEQLSNQSGVNLDEELSKLIVFQNSYAAAARVVTAVDEMFIELLNALG